MKVFHEYLYYCHSENFPPPPLKYFKIVPCICRLYGGHKSLYWLVDLFLCLVVFLFEYISFLSALVFTKFIFPTLNSLLRSKLGSISLLVYLEK